MKTIKLTGDWQPVMRLRVKRRGIVETTYILKIHLELNHCFVKGNQ